jgi:CheY-like chemotaxis protein
MSAKKTVLVVEDDFDVRDTLTEVLKTEGYQVQAFSDGLQALEYLQANPEPGVILLDWMMPRCDGLQFRTQQQEYPHLANVPVVLLTADARFAEKAAQLRAQDHLKKPVKLDRLLEVVSRYCN